MHSISGEIEEDVTDVVSLRRCTECGQEAELYVACRPPRIEDLSVRQFWRVKANAIPLKFECLIYGDPDFPAWWFCPNQRYFGVTGAFRVKVERPDDVTSLP